MGAVKPSAVALCLTLCTMVSVPARVSGENDKMCGAVVTADDGDDWVALRNKAMSALGKACRRPVQTTGKLQTVSPKTMTILQTLPPKITTKLQTVPPRTTTKLQTLPPKTTTKLQTVPQKTTTKVQTVPPKTTTILQTVPPKTTTKLQTVPPQTTTKLQTVPPKTTTKVQTVPPRTTTATVANKDCPFVFVTEATPKADRSFKFILNPLVPPFRLSFEVKAPSRAMILLASERTSGSVFAEIAIGNSNNQGAFIRTCYSGDLNCDTDYKPASVSITGLVSREVFRAFWVDFGKEGVITVGKEGEDASLLEWNAGMFHGREYPEVHVGIGTFGDGERGDWVFHAFCE